MGFDGNILNVIPQPANNLESSVIDGGKSKDRVLINVGGTRHECYISTIQNFPDTRLHWIAETAQKMVDFDPEANEFFFDRHPGCFQNILNYCRTGKLHCPNDVCGPLFEQELAFWGIDELQMEPCCWGTYTQHRNAHKHLKMFDSFMDGNQEEEEECDDVSIKYEKTDFIKFIGPFLKMRPKVWALLERPYSSGYAQVAAFTCLLVIVVSIVSFCIETMRFARNHDKIFEHLEYFYCAFFTVEFTLRLMCCPSYKKFFKSLMAWIDIISTVQFYINFFAQSSAFDFLLVLRLVRIFRLFRFFKNLSGMQVIGQTLKASANELFLLALIVLIPMVIFSTLVYYAEQKVRTTDFTSIPESFWWAIVTMTTVGYGDVTPTSVYGKLIGALCACSGVLIVALPVSVIGSNFTLYYSYAQARLRLPKRTSPALVLADKALMNVKSNPGDDGGSKKSSKSSSSISSPQKDTSRVSSGLKGLAEVMVDIAVPTRERRCAIQPAITPFGPLQPTPGSKKASTFSLHNKLGKSPMVFRSRNASVASSVSVSSRYRLSGASFLDLDSSPLVRTVKSRLRADTHEFESHSRTKSLLSDDITDEENSEAKKTEVEGSSNGDCHTYKALHQGSYRNTLSPDHVSKNPRLATRPMSVELFDFDIKHTTSQERLNTIHYEVEANQTHVREHGLNGTTKKLTESIYSYPMRNCNSDHDLVRNNHFQLIPDKKHERNNNYVKQDTQRPTKKRPGSQFFKRLANWKRSPQTKHRRTWMDEAMKAMNELENAQETDPLWMRRNTLTNGITISPQNSYDETAESVDTSADVESLTSPVKVIITNDDSETESPTLMRRSSQLSDSAITCKQAAHDVRVQCSDVNAQVLYPL